MNPTNDRFNQHFRDRFQDFEDPNVSDHNWEAIQSAIPQKQSFFQRNWKKSSVLLLFLLVSTCVFQSKWHNSLAPNLLNTSISETITANNSKLNSIVEPTPPSVKTPFLTQNPIKKEIINAENKTAIKSINSDLIAVNSIKNNALITENKPVFNSENNAINNDNLIKNKGLINANKDELINQKNSINKPELIVFNKENNALINAEINDLKENITPIKTALIAQLQIINSQKPITYSVDNQELIISDSKFAISNFKSKISNSKFIIHPFINLTPQYSFFNFTPNVKDKIILNNFELNTGISPKRIGIKLETGIAIKLNKYFQINAAINAQTINKNVVYTTHTNVLDSFKVEALNVYNIRIERVANLQKIEEQNTFYAVGFNAAFQINGRINRSLNYFISSGIGMNKLLNYSELSSSSYDFSIGVSRPFNKKYAISLAPQITYFTQNNAFSSPVLEAKPYTIGLKLGITQR